MFIDEQVLFGCDIIIVIIYVESMNSDDRKRIKVNWDKLVENLMVAAVCDKLMAAEVIDDEEYEVIVVLEKTRKERVRSLLRTLMQKSGPSVLQIFCVALVEADPIYVYLADAIRDTDVSSVEDYDVVDSRNKQDALVETVLRQSDELMKLNEEYRRQIAELTERNKILEQQQLCVKALEGRGFTEKSLLQFVDVFILAKNIRGNTAIARGASQNFPYPDILQKMSSETLSQDQLKVCLLSIYVVQHVVTSKCRYTLPDSFQCYSTKISDIINDEMRAHPDLFDNAIQKLHIVEINGLNTFDAVADAMFLDGACNWGRVVAWFAFCASLAKNFPDTTSPDTLDFYAIFSWFYINNRMYDWIVKAGGWVWMINFCFIFNYYIYFY